MFSFKRFFFLMVGVLLIAFPNVIAVENSIKRPGKKISKARPARKLYLQKTPPKTLFLRKNVNPIVELIHSSQSNS